MTGPREPSELERWLHQELWKLPELKAPAGLRERVWARLQAEAMRPWWQRSWWHWPKSVQVTAALPLLGLTLLLAIGPWLLESYLPGSNLVLAPLWERILDLSGILVAVGRAVWLVAEALVNNAWFWIASGLVFLSYLWCVGLGTFLVRFARRHTGRGGQE